MILVLVLGVFFAGSLLYKYNHFILNADYIVTATVSCDPAIQNCFISVCDPETDEACDLEPYAYIEKSAHNVPYCNSHEMECPELTCEEGEENCSFIFCSAETALPDEEICTNSIDS